MTNQEFIEFVVRDKKVPYDNNLLSSVLHQYFKSSVELLEKQIDFNYMERTTLFTLLKDSYEVPLTDNVKKVVSLYDKTHMFELYGDDDVSVFYKLFSDKPAIPKKFVVSNNKILFPTPLKENTDFVIRYYAFTYNTELTNLNNSHPLINENFQLLLSTLGVLIDRYYSPTSQDAEFHKVLKNVERDTQQQKRRIVSTVRFDIERY